MYKIYYFIFQKFIIIKLFYNCIYLCIGTNGGISWAGLFMSFLGGIIVGLSYYLTVLITVDTVVLQLATSQWPVIIIGGIGGFIGSVIDSILGATLQYSGE